MHVKKILFIIFVFVSVLLIYKFANVNKINYVVLGDSLAAGRNPYDNYDYGYADYIKEYLDKKQLLGTYVNKFAVSGNKISNIVDDIDNNKCVIQDGISINIRKALRESDLVTLSIGANDFKDGINLVNLNQNLENLSALKTKVDDISKKIDSLLKLIKKYAKGDIIVIGYYNPFPYLDSYKKQIDEIVKYSNIKYNAISEKNGCTFINLFEIFDNNVEFLPNPFDIHPNHYGYKAIFDMIKEYLDNNYIANN